MKTNCISIACAVLILSACQKKNDPGANSIAGLTSLMKDGTWHVTRFVKDNDDKTHHFSDYSFNFRGDNMLNANNGEDTYMGTWMVTDGNCKNNTGFTDLGFRISFISPPAFNDLSRDWDISDKNRGMVELIDVSWSDGGVDYLTFVRD